MSKQMDPMEEPQAELVMPFVTVTSVGGPHDDAAYTAGYAMGCLDWKLGCWDGFDEMTLTATVAVENKPQADLLAMRHGFTAAFSEIDEHPNYLSAVFSR